MRDRASPICPALDFAVLALDLARRTLPLSQRPPLVTLLQNNLSAMLDDLGAPWKYLRSAILRAHRASDGIVFLSEGVRADFFRLVPDYSGRTTLIPNAAWSAELDQKSRAACPISRPVDRRVIVTCGRLHRQKGFDVLLRAFAQTNAEIPSELRILGEGPERGNLATLAQQLGVREHVRFLGFQHNPLAFFRAADLFVLSSRWEGFGNVIVEALGCGTPVVSTDCPFGPSEILEDGRWGRLTPVGNSACLASAMKEVLCDPQLREKLGTTGPIRARDFSAPNIARAYAEFLGSFAPDAA